jgi:hypothetical protein
MREQVIRSQGVGAHVPAPFHATCDTIQYRYLSTSRPDAASRAWLLLDSHPLELLDELAEGDHIVQGGGIDLRLWLCYNEFSLEHRCADSIAASLTAAAVTEAAGSPW